ncbi:MAG: DNA polymerase III subunit gamma/tau [Proteobacteria bacterium]|nr:DNA polymerase III subunit gamma/tau [Pseudomonadota bacterium]HQR02657.1 DNA polymerase III subunit gamma/tau [Rhodocyclaceae bacterium]
MSYQVLARKWRPKSFDTLVGQEHVVRALTHALEKQRLHHAYLFTGTRGVGKTTIARIMAKALNCETGITPAPCGVCSSCVEIDDGRFVDLIEVDAATNTKVEEMRQLLENAIYAPTRGRFKVYVIDEVHMLSKPAFNAMLKTLEEPPEHIKFILATTDPQKIPVTVLSRCLQFNLKQMPQGHIVEHLSRVLGDEGIVFQASALRQLAKAAAGSMRDALSLLDQAIAHGGGKIEEDGVRDMLGTVGDDYLYSLLDALMAGNATDLLAVADCMEARSLDFDSALQELATLFHRIALLQLAPDAISDDSERARLKPYATGFDAEFLQLCYQIAIHGKHDLELAPDEYTGFSMSLLRLLAFRPDVNAGSGPVTGATTSIKDKMAVNPVRNESTASATPVRREPEETDQAKSKGTLAKPEASERMDDDWHRLVARLPLPGMVRQLAQHCELVAQDEGSIRLRLAPAHKHVLGKMQQDKLQFELQNHYGRPLRLEIELAATASVTPAEVARSQQRERQERAVAAIESDSFVRDTRDLLGASIDESTIKPV